MVLSFQLFENRLGLVANAVAWPILSFGLGLLVFAGAERDTIIGKYHLPFVGWLAAASYSLYLMHKAADHVVQAHWGSSLAQTGGLGLSCLCKCRIVRRRLASPCHRAALPEMAPTTGGKAR